MATTTAMAKKESTHLVPDWMAKRPVKGLEQASLHQTFQRMDVIQALSKPEIVEQFGVGSVIMQPEQILIAKFGEAFRAVPVFHYSSYAKWLDINDPESAVAPVAAESLDVNGALARLSKNPATREEAYGKKGELSYRYCEHINFVFAFRSASANGLASHTFSKGSWTVGNRLCCFLARKKDVDTGQQQTSIFGHVLQLSVGKASNKRNQSWYQIDFQVPPTASTYTNLDEYDAMERLYDELAAAHAARLATELGGTE